MLSSTVANAHRAVLTPLLILAAFLSSCAPATPSASPPRQARVTSAPNTAYAPTLAALYLTGCSTAGSLRIRAEPNTHSDILGSLGYRDCVRIFATDHERTWLAIGETSPTGWVSVQHMTVDGDLGQLPVMDNLPTTPEPIILPTFTASPRPATTSVKKTSTPPVKTTPPPP